MGQDRGIGGGGGSMDAADSMGRAEGVPRELAALVRQLLTLARRQLPSMQLRHVVAVMWALKRLRAPDAAAAAALLRRYLELLPLATPGEAGAGLLVATELGAFRGRAAAAAAGGGGGRGSGGTAAALAPRPDEGSSLMSMYVKSVGSQLLVTAALGRDGGRQLALALHALQRWTGRAARPRGSFLRAWARAAAPRLGDWAPRDVAMGAAALGHWREWSPAAEAWVGAAMAAALEPGHMAAMKGADAAGLLAGFAGMQWGAEAAAAASAARGAPGPAVGAEGRRAQDVGIGAVVVKGDLGARWWAAHQASTLVLLPSLTLQEISLLLTSSARLRLTPDPEWVESLGRRGLDLARGAAARPRTHGAACLLLVALARAAGRLPPDAATDARRALAPGVAAVAGALAPHLAGDSGPLDLVQIASALSKLGVRPGPAFVAAHTRGVERVSHALTGQMWRQVRDAYAALRLAPSEAMVRSFIVHLG
ncbi:hypothetical protein MNEG_11390 [Monoraphidium neglectum]|uniref:Uncharacterized protein n=1 Tax=Monoraphidium neglectum TaxID=145388 RepID=A0A0D2M5R5_9CHLO|nr:hypothetical protein MNEG_11390 [Monoraphidium neglectum]KIY96571.1 hypothetical protein MNEG_11390 [Monoraphidium neglectum]|eukprot:XP_013895591.1 hypothetical protein MNEG_11390 [Monoraphidium neglectum]